MKNIKHLFSLTTILIIIGAGCGKSIAKKPKSPITFEQAETKSEGDLNQNLTAKKVSQTTQTTAINPPVEITQATAGTTLLPMQTSNLPRRIVFDVSGNFTVPDGITRFRVTVVGGGGGGAGVVAHSTTELGGGGGGGAEVKHMVDVSIPPWVNSIPITVGKGGKGGIPATDGEKSSFGYFLEALGGKAPAAVQWGGTTQYYIGGAAGGPGGSAGANGFASASANNIHKPGGAGGATILGTGGPSIMPYQDPTKVGPSGYGGGGGGGDSRNKGGSGTVDGVGDDGGNGVVIVEY